MKRNIKILSLVAAMLLFTGLTFAGGTVGIKGDIGTDQYEPVRLDGSTESIQTIDYPHHEIHSGSAYYLVYSALKDTDGTIEVRIQTPDSAKYAHMVIAIESALAGTAELWASTTKTHVVGNVLTGMNRNFNSDNTSNLTICHTPAGSQAGAANLLQYMGAATQAGKADQGGGADSRHEFILKRNTAYLIKIMSRADANALSIILDWYEHTDRN